MFTLLTVLVLAGLAGPLLAAGPRGLVPVVIGELLAGAVLGRTGFGVINPAAQPLPAFAAIGFAMLMMQAGTHVNLRSVAIRTGLVRGLLTFLTTAAISFPLGVLVAHVLNFPHALLFGVLIAGSSAAIAFPVLEERGLIDSAATLIAWIAVADSVTVVVMPLTIAGGRSVALAIAGDAAIVAAGALLMAILPRVPQSPLLRESRERGWAYQVRLVLLLLLGLSAVAQMMGASTLVAGFVTGIVLARVSRSTLSDPDAAGHSSPSPDPDRYRLALQLQGVANGFFVPLFFVLLGAEIDLRSLVSSPSALVLAVALAAAAVVAHAAAAAIAGSGRRLATGLAASAQLGLPAAAASLGLSTHVLSPPVAAALVAAGCLTLAPATAGAFWLGRSAAAPARLG